MKHTLISIMLIFILLLILICIIKQKKNNNDSPYKSYLMHNDINYKVSNVFINSWFSGILIKDTDRLFQMIHPKSQMDCYLGRGTNSLKVMELLSKIDIHPNYKIKHLHTTLTNHNMIVTHDLYQEETNTKYSSIFSLVKDSNLKWKVISWVFYIR